jgi:chemotaxis protein CheD
MKAGTATMADIPLVIKMAEMAVVENSKLLKTTLGSCVGIVLHDGKKKISGLAHILLPEPIRKDRSVGKYAETAIPALFNRVLKRGASKRDVRAYVAGGANMFRASQDTKIATIGERNVEAVKRILQELGIPIVFEQTGGDRGRTVVFDNAGSDIQVKTVGPLTVGKRSAA